MTSLSPQPVDGLVEDRITQVCQILSPLMTNVDDETANPITVPVVSVNRSDVASFPEITVNVIPARAPFNLGWNQGFWDNTRNVVQYFVYMPDSQLVIDVRGRSDAERKYLTDRLYGSILASYYMNGLVPVENAILQAFAAIGIVMTETPELEEFVIESDGPRPEGQIWVKRMRFYIDLWLAWTSPPFQVDNIQVNGWLVNVPGMQSIAPRNPLLL